ncbi:ribonuclease R [Microbulbifer flavimaris]|uniref:Ribonuclease R n=1 Tax=Microbulbifer flavimaris TaxID=1781068 RepID=A0ABX4HZW0_9GAMM|nr:MULTISPECIES: ribonuclease R [Microbulbifer]KUJ83450.1 exoribonuclease R [Microbulbifer sp. ZGT114]PCO05606.1 ribonuclease R [Microbulbifer flavimaris]
MSKAPIAKFNSLDAEKYSNPIPAREFIMSLLGKSDEVLDRERLAKVLHLSGDAEKEALRRRLRAMERDGQILFDRRQGYSLIKPEELLTGRVIGHPDGFGFLTCDGAEDDLFLSDNEMLTVFDGDRVQARISGTDRRGRKIGVIVNVLKRNTSHLVGRVQFEDDHYFLKPENSRIAHEIDLDRDELMGAKAGQYVSVEIIDFPSHRYNAFGRVTELLGNAMAPGMEIDVAIRSHDIPHTWPKAVVHAARQLGTEVPEADKLHRADLRQLPFVTIDGEDARDFDDAVYCKKEASGNWRLFVAIADVSHYVAPGSALDLEAQNRATSVYFPGRVVPMLPESLSNGLCSLNPRVDRLVMVCEMTISKSGKMTDYTFSEGVIHSHARLTYNQVNAFINSPDSGPGRKTARKLGEIGPHIHALHQLYSVLKKARTKRGAMDFEKPEVQFKFTQDRKIERIVPVNRNDAHMMIEEFMLSANVATAGFLKQQQMPALYRVHEGPRDKKLTTLRAFLNANGLKLAGGNEPRPKHYDQLLSSIGQRSDAQIIRTMMLRSLSQAEYSPDNRGHFGLAYSAYAHFTSPIRRYPDLMVHRAIRSVIRKPKQRAKLPQALKLIFGGSKAAVKRFDGAALLPPQKSYPYDKAAVQTLAEHCSNASRRADKASWDVEAWLKCEYMQDFVGEVFQGQVSSVTHFGLFIEIDDLQVEGLIHISALKKDYYNFDAANQYLTGERSNTRFAIGDAIRVRVARVDMERRKIEFALAD